ncbi:MAG: iron-sulfur cluster-binding domain-containing protein, partial [Oscillospiraceae bacterium]|nr:iron-sulfur cluster-binding domain-containing protein [Oscillospiraceae bacterium]
GKIVSRPYSISSAPFEARKDPGYIEITVRRSKGDGFIADFVNDGLTVGTVIKGNIGLGQFYYEPLRDAHHIMALAGGVGITPFASMAKEIYNGTMDAELTILYGSVASNDIILKDELAALESDRVHVVNVLSGDEPDWTGERGFLSAELIKKYTKGDTSYFICGPQVMYRFLREEIKKLDVPARRVRFEVFGQAKDITAFAGYPVEKKDETYTVTVVRGIHKDEISAKANESLVVALERAGIRIETACRSGECGFCRTKVLSGEYYVCPENDGRRAADRDFNYVHACAAYPLSDMTIKIPIE